MIKVKIKKGDKVLLRIGKDSGKIGKVISVNQKKRRISVEGLNILIKHVRPRRQGEKGQRVQFPRSIDISNVILVCPKCNKPTRVGWQVFANKKKSRVCNKCKEVID